MLCVWFWMGCKVAYNVVRGQGAEDTRSDAEERFDLKSARLSFEFVTAHLVLMQ